MTGEQPPSPERKGRYDSARDEALYELCLGGWGNESSGNQASLTGYFSRIRNEPADLHELEQNFGEDFARVGLTDTSQLVGDFIVTETSDGFVKVGVFGNELDAKRAFNQLERIYQELAGGAE